MKLQVKNADEEMPVDVWLEQQANGLVSIYVGKANERFKIAFLSGSGRLLGYQISPEPRRILEEWGFQFENNFIKTKV